MSTRAPVSVCMIVRDEAACLGACLDSIRPYVEEIVVVDTGSVDDTQGVALRHKADILKKFTDCNDPETGLIEDFSLARNYSFSLGSQPWRFWIDGDDELVGGAELARVCERYDRERGDKAAIIAFPYEYDPHCHQFRERLVTPWDAFSWTHPIHETIELKHPETTMAGVDDSFRILHHKSKSKKPIEANRNIRILRKLHAKIGESDARILFYLGRELSFRVEHETEGLQFLERYVEISGWDEEKALACLRSAEVYQARGQHQKAIEWANRAITLAEKWGEGYFTIGRSYYAMAEASKSRRDWQRAVHYFELGLMQPPTKTLLFVNPTDRAISVHRFLNIALNKVGDVEGALASTITGLAERPDDGNLLLNRAVYEAHLAERASKNARKMIESHRKTLEGAGLTAAQVVVAPPEYAALAKAMAENRIVGMVSAPDQSSAQASVNSAGGGYRRPAEYPRGVTDGDFPRAALGPHAQAWVIPQTSVLDDLPVRMTAAQLEAATLLLWKEYVLHDEVLAAERLLADAPYRVKHSPTIAKALEWTRQYSSWMDDADLEQETNAPADPTVECGVALPAPLTGQLLGRYEIARSRLLPGDSVIDLGCSDGSIANRLALTGCDIVGVDLCESSIALAKRKAEEFKTGARFLCSRFDRIELYDDAPVFNVVISTDVYEHLRNHVSELIAPARVVLENTLMTGRMILCTPHGAWMRGEYVPWAHPWRWADEKGSAWNAPERRAHLVAPTPWTVAGHFRSDGWWVKDSFVELCAPAADVPGQGNVICEAWLDTPYPDLASADELFPLDIVIACPPYAYEDWTPETARKRGIGGSETAVVEMSKRLVASGHRVRVYATPGEHGDGIYDGVEYRHSAHLDNVAECDVLIAWRYAEMLEKVPQARLKLLWVHDVMAHGATSARMLLADKVLALSEWHAINIAKVHDIGGGVCVTRNGIDLSRFFLEGPYKGDRPARDPHKAVNSSSPDRSWLSLLRLWPRVRARVPDATLHLFYGFENWEKAAASVPGEQAKITELRAHIGALQDHGVVLRGRVDQKTLAREFLSAGVWAYPTWFSETSCISAMEAQAAGLALVTSPIAGLKETCPVESTYWSEGDWLSERYQGMFEQDLVTAMTQTSPMQRAEMQARARERFSWDGVASEWVTLIRAELERKETDPLVPYAPAKGFER